MKQKLIWNSEDCTDGITYDWDGTEEDAERTLKNIGGDMLVEWLTEEIIDRHLDPDPRKWSEDERERWDYMIDECYVYVATYRGDKFPDDWGEDTEGVEEYFMDDCFLADLGWKYYDELVEDYENWGMHV